MKTIPKNEPNNGFVFPKKIGIVFFELRRLSLDDTKKTKFRNFVIKLKTIRTLRSCGSSLDFNQDACSFFFLQMNKFQKTFEFQVVETKSIPDNRTIIDWLDNMAESSHKDIDYWIAITDKPIGMGKDNWFFDTISVKNKYDNQPYAKSGKRLWIVSTQNWEKYFSPPSLFEYLACTIVRCAIESLVREIQGELKQEKALEIHDLTTTKGCIFDFTSHKPLRRILVSNPSLCYYCIEKLKNLETKVQAKTNSFPLVIDIKNIVSREWMGSPEQRDSPIYNLKKIYKYDVDRNSGYYKSWTEKIRDSVIDNTAVWAIGTVVGGVISAIIALVFGVFFGMPR